MNKKNFSIKSLIAVVLITSIVSALTVGIIINNNYKNYNHLLTEDIKEFLKVYDIIDQEYYGKVNKTKLINSAVEGMMKFLEDNYTDYITKEDNEDLQQTLNGSYKGIGIIVLNKEIDYVIPQSPADKKGVLKGDIVTKVNNKEVEKSEDIINFMQERSDSVDLTLLRNEKTIELSVPVKKIDNPVVFYEKLENDLLYIKIDKFSSTVGDQFKKVLNTVDNKESSGIIIDIRNNHGGYLKGAVDIASMFLEKGKKIVSLETKNKKKEIIYSDSSTPNKTKVVILMNENSASASEILTAALVDNKRAISVGSISYGKGKIQQTYEMKSGSSAKYTTGLWFTPNNINIDQEGLKPTHKIELDIYKNEIGEVIKVDDTQLEFAVKYFEEN